MKVAIIQIENYKKKYSSEYLLEEMISLAQAMSSDIEIVYTDIIKISHPNSYSLIGSGNLDKYKNTVEDLKIDLVIVNYHLSAIQNRNLSKELKCLVFDRTRTILEIFDRNAHSNAGKLQVRLAYLEYEKSRLVRSWTHLERQRGSLGKIGGPGEKQIELDHRMINEKIEHLQAKLKELAKTRDVQQKSRNNGTIVSLVGYTSAGKSTLFKQLTKKEAKTSYELFTTLDPRIGKINLPCGEICYLVDTVGFIHDLPHQLVNAFHTTLEQINEADYILHIQDCSSPQRELHEKDVISVLDELKIDNFNNKIINIYNKIDLNPTFQILEKEEEKINEDNLDKEETYDPIKSNIIKKKLAEKVQIKKLYISALNGDGCKELIEEINRLVVKNKFVKVSINADEIEKIQWLSLNKVQFNIEGEKANFLISKSLHYQMLKKFPT